MSNINYVGMFAFCAKYKENVSTFVTTDVNLKLFLFKKSMLLNVKKRGNSLSVIIPKEIATNLNVDDGDALYLTKTPNGYEISAFDPDFADKMEIARRGIKKYRNALIDLAK